MGIAYVRGIGGKHNPNAKKMIIMQHRPEQ